MTESVSRPLTRATFAFDHTHDQLTIGTPPPPWPQGLSTPPRLSQASTVFASPVPAQRPWPSLPTKYVQTASSANATPSQSVTDEKHEALQADCHEAAHKIASRSTPATVMAHPNRLTQQRSEHVHDTGRRSHVPAASGTTLPSTRAAKPAHTPSTVAAPATRTFFDPWNSSSTGHQRAENRLSGSTAWRSSRNLKLGNQYQAGLTGGKRVADTVGAGSQDFGKDGRKENGGWEKGAKGLRTGGQKSLAETWSAGKSGKKSPQEKDRDGEERSSEETLSHRDDEELGSVQDTHSEAGEDEPEASSKSYQKKIFAGLCVYTNGSTAPLVSDHKLKQLLATNGARHSIALGRRSVTHVILGTANAHGGAGGGLAASKIEKEIGRSGRNTVKFVTAEWVLESIKANRRLPESQFSPLKLAPQSQTSILGMIRTNSAAKLKKDQT